MWNRLAVCRKVDPKQLISSAPCNAGGKEVCERLGSLFRLWTGGMVTRSARNPDVTAEIGIKEGRFIARSGITALHTCIATGISLPVRYLSTVSHAEKPGNEDASIISNATAQPQRIKFKRLDKTARNIMNILDKEEVNKVKANRDIADIKPGCIVQLKVEFPENKRRVSVLKGIVIARRNAGLHTTFRLRRMVAGVGVESVFPLYSPNIKEMKVLDKKDCRRAKLYYLRDRMDALKQKK